MKADFNYSDPLIRAQLEGTLPLVTEEAEAHKKLMAIGIVPRVKWLAVERERIGVQQALAAQLEQRRVLNASLDSLRERLHVTEAQYQGRWMTELTEAETKIASYDEEIAKAERRPRSPHRSLARCSSLPSTRWAVS